MIRRNFLLSGVGLAAAATSSWALAYPDRVIRISQGFAAGGNADVIARVVGNEMAKKLGQSVIV
jgi:tripartite-type tricarboxylate transporter receptor subunit TctC